MGVQGILQPIYTVSKHQTPCKWNTTKMELYAFYTGLRDIIYHRLQDKPPQPTITKAIVHCHEPGNRTRLANPKATYSTAKRIIPRLLCLPQMCIVHL